MRRLPVYFLLDGSPRMMGEPIWAFLNSIQSLISSLRCFPEMIESVSISVTIFSSEPENILPLTELKDSIVLPIEFKSSLVSSLLNTGKAIDFLIKMVEPEIFRRKEYVYLNHKPLIFLITSGNPNDSELYNTSTKKLNLSDCSYKIGCLFRNNDIIELKKFSNNIIMLEDGSSESFKQLMLWCKELILTIINDDLGVFDTDETINPYYPVLPQPTSALKFI